MRPMARLRHRSLCFQQVTGATVDDHFNINDSSIQQELKYHVVDDLLNEQVQEVRSKFRWSLTDKPRRVAIVLVANREESPRWIST